MLTVHSSAMMDELSRGTSDPKLLLFPSPMTFCSLRTASAEPTDLPVALLRQGQKEHRVTFWSPISLIFLGLVISNLEGKCVGHWDKEYRERIG